MDIQWTPGAPLSGRSPATHTQEIYTLDTQTGRRIHVHNTHIMLKRGNKPQNTHPTQMLRLSDMILPVPCSSLSNITLPKQICPETFYVLFLTFTSIWID